MTTFCCQLARINNFIYKLRICHQTDTWVRDQFHLCCCWKLGPELGQGVAARSHAVVSTLLHPNFRVWKKSNYFTMRPIDHPTLNMDIACVVMNTVVRQLSLKRQKRWLKTTRVLFCCNHRNYPCPSKLPRGLVADWPSDLEWLPEVAGVHEEPQPR